MAPVAIRQAVRGSRAETVRAGARRGDLLKRDAERDVVAPALRALAVVSAPGLTQPGCVAAVVRICPAALRGSDSRATGSALATATRSGSETWVLTIQAT